VQKPKVIKQRIGKIWDLLGNRLGIIWERLGTNGPSWETIGRGWETASNTNRMKVRATNAGCGGHTVRSAQRLSVFLPLLRS
jgi:hypothetical protein